MRPPPHTKLSVQDVAKLFSEKMPHGRDIGMMIDKLDGDKTRIRLPPNPTLAADPAGNFFFPGILFSLADSACGLAVFQALNRFVPIATLDMRIDHLAPATMDADLIAEAHCYRLTKQIAFARCELLCGNNERLVAIAVGTFMVSSGTAKGDAMAKAARGPAQ